LAASVLHSPLPSLVVVTGSQLPDGKQLSQRSRCAYAHSATEP
jgi:hypothetical protein